jgi:hypothetical protein
VVPDSTLALVSTAAYQGRSSGREASVSEHFPWDDSFACSRPCQRAHTGRIRNAVSPKPRRILCREGFSLRIQRCLAWYPSAATARTSRAVRRHQRRLHVKHDGGLQGYKSIVGMPNVVSVCAGGCAWASRLSRWKSCRVPAPARNSRSSPQRLA